VVLPKGTLHIHRTKLLWKGVCHEAIRLSHHGEEAATVRLEMTFDGDFVDLFEVRGMQRSQRGERGVPEVAGSEVVLPYRGRDGLLRRTRVRFDPAPRALDAGRASFELQLEPGHEKHVYCCVLCECEGEPAPRALGYAAALQENNGARARGRQSSCSVTTSNPLVNLWLDRSVSDLAMLTTELPTGPYPFAGVPWYSTTFGRDGILTALEYLWIDPSLARGVLGFLAATQATETDPERDAEPGKILHEARASEMANTREIPFGRYYGTVDATPLFLVLAAAYWRRTGDTALLKSIWPNLLAALHWIDTFGDPDGDGFVEYQRKSKDGLTQQGWKDSHDSVFHADGQMASAPIALCEVQGYVYQGKSMLAEVAHALGDAELAARLAQQAEELERKFQAAFWCEDLGGYALALDGRQEALPRARLQHGPLPVERHRVARACAARDRDAHGPAFFSGWGIRTIAQGEPRYNPMSYHNGSDLAARQRARAAGMARYGRTAEAAQMLASLFEASLHFDLHRLPELFCGFPRRDGAGPTLYPVACSPQAWAAAAPFAILAGLPGARPAGERHRDPACTPAAAGASSTGCASSGWACPVPTATCCSRATNAAWAWKCCARTRR
jgi:glycogen debranching enzyme